MKTAEIPASVLATVIDVLERIIDAPGLPGVVDREDMDLIKRLPSALGMALEVSGSVKTKKDVEALMAAVPDQARDVTIEHDWTRYAASCEVRRSSYEVRYWVPMNSGDMYLTVSQRLEIVEDPKSDWGRFRCYTIASDSRAHDGACPGGEA